MESVSYSVKHQPAAELALDDDETTVVDELRQLMARADALASTTNEQFNHVLADGDDRRGFTCLAHLVEMTALAVSAVSEVSSKFIATVESDQSQGRT